MISGFGFGFGRDWGCAFAHSPPLQEFGDMLTRSIRKRIQRRDGKRICVCWCIAFVMVFPECVFRFFIYLFCFIEQDAPWPWWEIPIRDRSIAPLQRLRAGLNPTAVCTCWGRTRTHTDQIIIFIVASNMLYSCLCEPPSSSWYSFCVWSFGCLPWSGRDIILLLLSITRYLYRCKWEGKWGFPRARYMHSRNYCMHATEKAGGKRRGVMAIMSFCHVT